MTGVKGPFSEGGISEGVCGGFREQGYWARCLAKREPSPASIGSDRSHPCCLEGYCYGWEERSVDRSTCGKLLRRTTPQEEDEIGWEPIAFNDDDLKGIIQPHDDALMVTARINGFIVKKVMVD